MKSDANGNGKAQPAYEDVLAEDRDRITLLDRVLEGATDQQKARVRSVLTRLEIDDDDEFYIVITAIGYLMVLVKDAPENWRVLFDDFEGKLGAWAQQNVRTLEAIYKQADNTNRMATCFQKLASSSTELSSETRASVTRLDKLNTALTSFQKNLKQTEQNSLDLVTLFEQTDQRIARLEKLVTWTSRSSLGLLVLLLLGGGIALRHMSSQNQFIEALMLTEDERSGWMLTKANRAECWYGIKPLSDKQCQE